MFVYIRPMIFADRAPLLRMIHSIEAFNQSDRAIAEEVLDDYLAEGDLSGYYVLVAQNGASLTGFVCYGPTPLTTGTWDIYWMAVDPEVWRQGTGKRLMTAAENEIEKAGGRIILIETSSRPEYEQARAFYASFGYEITARVADFYAPGDDKVIYSKRLNSMLQH